MSTETTTSEREELQCTQDCFHLADAYESDAVEVFPYQLVSQDYAHLQCTQDCFNLADAYESDAVEVFSYQLISQHLSFNNQM